MEEITLKSVENDHMITKETDSAFLYEYQNTNWSNSHIVKILKNEKYVGDLVQKKTFTPDYLSHAKKYNHGEEEMICLTDHHEPIIDRELWNTVQAELKKRNYHGELGAGHSNRYVFSGKIKCAECGNSFVSRKKYRRDGRNGSSNSKILIRQVQYKSIIIKE